MRARLWTITLATALAACAGSRPPVNFLKADTSEWNNYLSATVDVSLRNIPLGDLAKYAPFKELRLEVAGGIDLTYPITLEEKHITRRRALWMIAQRYGLSIRAVRPFTLHVTYG